MIEERIVSSNQNHMALIYVNTKSVCCILALSRHIGQTGMSVRGDPAVHTEAVGPAVESSGLELSN